MREIERRQITLPVEFRSASDGGGSVGTLVGYAAKFNTMSQDLGGFVETIAPGAFTKTLNENVRAMCRYNHADAHLLGTTEAGTLRLTVDTIGLLYEVDLPDTSSGRDCAALAARGDLRYSSFAFYCIKDDWSFDEEADTAQRILREVQLVDVAPVNSPAYLDTTVAKRSLEEHRPEPSIEPEARDASEQEEVEPPKHSAVPVSVLLAQAELAELQ